MDSQSPAPLASNTEARRSSRTARPLSGTSDRRKYVSTACTACKVRKSKCTGISPCDSCVKNGLECIIDTTTDNRSQPNHKRKIETLEQDRELLINLVSELRDSGNKDVVQLLNLIRSNASLQEIKMALDDKVRSKAIRESPELDNVLNEVSTLRRTPHNDWTHGLLDVNRLSDRPVFTVPAKPWTNVTEDDCLLDRDAFIKDMQSARLDCEYCSTFLVNIILADACAYCDYPEALSNKDDPFSKGLHFYEEAKRQLDLELGRISLTTLQGLGVLWVCTTLMGKDRQGWLYQNQSIFAINDFFKRNRPNPEDSDEVRRTQGRMFYRTVWGHFPTMTASALTYQKPPLLREPQHWLRLPINHDDPADKWSPYPSPRGQEFQGHLNCTFNSHCDLNEIAIQVNRLLFSEDEASESLSKLPTLDELYAQLQSWYSNVPQCLNTSGRAMPHVLTLHMYYHNIVATMFSLSRSKSNVTSKMSSQEMTDLVLSCARETATLADKQRLLWGADRVPVGNIQWITVALSNLLGHLDDEQNQEGFINLCVAAKAFSRRWPLARGMLRMIQLTARQMGIVLPKEARALFIEFEERIWSKNDREKFSSLYPNFFTSANRTGNRDSADVELDKVLDRWDNISIEKPGPAQRENTGSSGG